MSHNSEPQIIKRTLRQIIVINDDLKMSPGKVASQAAHVSVGAVWQLLDPVSRRDPSAASFQHKCLVARYGVEQWMHAPTKIVLRASTRQMLGVIKRAKRRGVRVYKFVDSAPTTEHTENKMTALAIGPLTSDKFKDITGHLKLY